MRLKYLFASALATMGVVFVALGNASAATSPVFNNRVEVNGKAADALIQSTEKLLQTGVPLNSLNSYSATYGSGATGYVVRLTAPNGKESRYVVSAEGVRATSSEISEQPKTMSGEALSALYQAAQAWKNTPIGKRASRADVGATIAHPFSNAPAVYWVYFAPPRVAHSRLALGCDTSRGFSVNVSTGKVTAFKPVC